MDLLFEALLGILGSVLEGLLDSVAESVLEMLAGVMSTGFHQLSAWFASFFG
jgi:hypothetical protein